MTSLTAKIEHRLRFEIYEAKDFEFLCAFLRVGFVLMAWTSQADLLALYSSQTLPQIVAGAVFLVVSTCALIGFGGPWSTLALAAVIAFNRHGLAIFDARPDLVYNHSTLLALVLLILSGAPSFSALTLFPRGPRRSVWNATDVLFLLRLTLVTVYLFAAYHKLVVILDDRASIQDIFMTNYTGSFGFLQPEHQNTFRWIAILDGLFEIALVFGLLIPRTRRATFWAALGFHAFLYWLLPVHVFSAAMGLLLLTCLKRETLSKLVQRLRGN